MLDRLVVMIVTHAAAGVTFSREAASPLL
jgi:hypothetical protein